MRGIKKLLSLVFTVAVIGFAVYVFMFGERMEEHIADTNGAENYSLAVLTEEKIVNIGERLSLGGPNTKETKAMLGLGGTKTTWYSKEYSGVSCIATWNLMWNSDLWFTIYDFEVTAGNFLMCIVHDGQIIAEIEPADGSIDFCMENVEDGTYELVIAGESAAFSFSAFGNEFE